MLALAMKYRDPVMGEELFVGIKHYYLDEDGTKVYWQKCHIDRIKGGMIGFKEMPWNMTNWDYAYEKHWILMGEAENYRIRKERYAKLKSEGKFKVKKK